MKGIYVIAIAFLASWTEVTAKEYQPEESIQKEGVYQDIPIKCPFPETNITTNLPHETDCTKFYKCFLGKGVLQDCPLMTAGDPNKRLHYNRREQVCDWPWQAGCAQCPGKDKNGNWPRSKIPHETDNCRMFYVCENGEKRLEYCPADKCFSRTCQDCVGNRAGGNCGNLELCSNGVKLPHECHCNMYHECSNGNYVLKYCYGGLHFDRTSKTCTTPDKAKCVN
ncbi:probable chitinase 10 [Temnothorax nylanderi]|uniref:probable chitinase 10 n=1 Tax=Temnothorax nylanderi TaxID=102681 RepID=UPI003A844530